MKISPGHEGMNASKVGQAVGGEHEYLAFPRGELPHLGRGRPAWLRPGGELAAHLFIGGDGMHGPDQLGQSPEMIGYTNKARPRMAQLIVGSRCSGLRATAAAPWVG